MAAEDLPDIESQLDALLAEAGLAEDPPAGRDPTRAETTPDTRAAPASEDTPAADTPSPGRPQVQQAEVDHEAELPTAQPTPEAQQPPPPPPPSEPSLAHEIDDMIAEGESAAYESDHAPPTQAADDDALPDAAPPEAAGPDESSPEAAFEPQAEAADPHDDLDDEVLGDIQSLDEALDEMLEEELHAAEAAAPPSAKAGADAQSDTGHPETPADPAPEASAQKRPPTADSAIRQPPDEITLPASADPDAFDPEDIDTADLEFEDPDEAKADPVRYEAAATEEGTASAVARELEADHAQQRTTYEAAEPSDDDPRDDPTRYTPTDESERRSQDASVDQLRPATSLLQTIALLIVQLLAVLNRPLRPLSPQSRDFVGYIGVLTLSVSLSLLAVVTWGLAIVSFSIIAVLTTLAAYLFYLLFIRHTAASDR